MNFSIPPITEITYLIPLLPALGAVILGLWGSRMSKQAVTSIACGSVGGSLLLSIITFRVLQSLPVDPHTHLKGWEQTLWTWFEAGPLNVPFGFLVDPLSSVMLLVVTGVGFLIHVYSTGYMDEDPGFWRFFAYLNLFMAAMLMLVLGSSVLTLFIGWEGVGLCSYLLIGFWWRDRDNLNPQPATTNVTAANKAFIVNRVGDFAFIIGVALLMWATWSFTDGHFTSLTFTEMRLHAQTYAGLEAQHWIGSVGVVTIATLLFFVGATGKSAQIPLFVWLPDAMAGPTPVSALIHAATMVTAGVYMIARLNFLYVLAPFTLTVIAVVGGLTALFAATIGLFQYDIKKVLAYSTISQLGYMFVGVGTGAFAAGIFHLFTHAFFKGLLFLGSGAIIHSMHHALPHGMDAQDMRHMGGLKKYMPLTTATFLVGWIAIIGLPPLAGFWSKDEILWKAAEKGFVVGHSGWYTLAYALGLAGAALTAFYMSRQVYMVFFGKYRGRDAGEAYQKEHPGHDPGEGHGPLHDPEEADSSMTLPLFLLAIASCVVGVLGLGAWTGLPNLFSDWLEPVFAQVGASATGHGVAAAAAGHGAGHAAHHTTWEIGLALVSVFVVSASLWLATHLYLKQPEKAERLYNQNKGKFGYRLIFNKYWVDELYDILVVQPVLLLKEIFAWFDRVIIDGLVHLLAWFVSKVLTGIVWVVDVFIVDGEDDARTRHGLVAGIASLFAFFGRSMRRLQTGDIQFYLRGIGAVASAAAAIWFVSKGFRGF